MAQPKQIADAEEVNNSDIDESPQYTVGGGFMPPNGTPLLFFYDCESTGGNIHYDHIVEIAAEVIEPEKVNITVKSFSELCYTPQPILGIGNVCIQPIILLALKTHILGCGVTDEMLVGKREFSAVFPDFLSWIQKCVTEAKKAAGNSFYPGLNPNICDISCTWLSAVLVAHYGFIFDFRLLTAEVERRKLMVQFLKADLLFADTGFELRKVYNNALYCI